MSLALRVPAWRMEETLDELTRKSRPWLVRPACAGFIINWPCRVRAADRGDAAGNPDVAELLAYNRFACAHERVPGAISREVLADEQRRHALWAAADVWEAWCGACKRLVLAVVA